MFRAGHDDAFRVIHDRYRQRLFAYTRQMLPRRQDAEDALQDIFVRAYAGLRANHRELALRAWLYRVAHNRCIDELRRPAPPPPEVMQLLRAPVHDPIAEADQRESLRRLIADVRRLPDQQRSALLMRELGGMSYADLSAALGVTVPAVKSLLVRARLALGQALEARDTACSQIREELIVAHDRGLRPGATARRHMHDCAGCREFRHQLRGVSRRFAAIVPTLGPLGVLANLLGFGGAGGGAAGGALAASGAAGTSSAVVGAGTLGAGHVATLLAAAVVTAGGAVEIQHVLPSSPPQRAATHATTVAPARRQPASVRASAASADATAPDESAPGILVSGRSDIGTASAGSSASSAGTAGSQAGTNSATDTTTKVKLQHASGGVGLAISGGAGLSASAGSTSGSAGGTNTTTTGTSTTPSPPGTSSAGSTQSPGDPATTTPSGSTSSTSPGQSTSSGPDTNGSSIASSSTSGTTGTGSPTGSSTSGPTSATQ
jgi:RNA polymerase sigma factor (sigma-70 family)